MWTYHQSSGKLLHEKILVAVGFAGQGEGRNNPAMQQVRHRGPLPQGKYEILDLAHSPKGIVGFPLLPAKKLTRKGSFWIHTGDSSRGCPIVEPKELDRIGEILKFTNDRQLQVVA